MERRDIYVGTACVCVVLIAFAVIMSIAIYKLESSVDTRIEKLESVLEEHRREERDRYFETRQDGKLEAIRVRDAIEEVKKTCNERRIQ